MKQRSPIRRSPASVVLLMRSRSRRAGSNRQARRTSLEGAGLAPSVFREYPLLNLDFDAPGRRRLAFRQMHGEHTVLRIGANAFLVDVVRHGETARERAAKTFHAVV